MAEPGAERKMAVLNICVSVCVCVKEIVSSLVIGPDGSEPLTGCDSSDKEGPSNV